MPEMPMWNTLSDSDQQAIRRAMEYWVRQEPTSPISGPTLAGPGVGADRTSQP